jgi:hypothetical protein
MQRVGQYLVKTAPSLLDRLIVADDEELTAAMNTPDRELASEIYSAIVPNLVALNAQPLHPDRMRYLVYLSQKSTKVLRHTSWQRHGHNYFDWWDGDGHNNLSEPEKVKFNSFKWNLGDRVLPTK